MHFQTITKIDFEWLPRFQPDGWSDISVNFKEYIDFDFCHPVALKDRHRPLATGVAIFFKNTAWLAHIIVAPEMRNKGFGLLMVEHLKSVAAEKKCRTISLIATDLGYPVYLKAGFKEQAEYLFFKNSLKEKEKEFSDIIMPAAESDFQKIYALDCRINGENRTRLLKHYLANSLVYKKNNEINGFYLPEMGEGLVVAEDEISGLALMKHRVLNGRQVVVPAPNKVCVAFLKANGLVRTLSARRMVWGQMPEFRPEKLFSRIAGNFG